MARTLAKQGHRLLMRNLADAGELSNRGGGGEGGWGTPGQHCHTCNVQSRRKSLGTRQFVCPAVVDRVRGHQERHWDGMAE
jgi:hypothetical protein